MFGFRKQKTSSLNDQVQTIAALANECCRFTPDVGVLETYQSQLLFVYGNEMRGHSKHEAVNEASCFMFSAFTKSRFTLWKHKLGKTETYPIALDPIHPRLPALPINGEVYAITPYQIIELDNEKENTVRFIRKRIRLIVPYQKISWFKDPSQADKLGFSRLEGEKHLYRLTQVQEITAWAYIGTVDYWSPRLDAGYSFGQVQHYEMRSDVPQLSKQYYYFNRFEYEKEDIEASLK